MKNRVNLKMGLQGWFRLRAGKPGAAPRIDTGWFPNLITDAGLNVIGTSSSWLSECRVGSGNTTPVNADTALESEVATTTNIHDTNAAAESSPPYFGSRTNTYRFAVGAAAGNLAEVGIGESSAGVLFSRALILDGLGDPTTITVLSDEVLDVTYQLRLYPPTVDATDTITIGIDDYDITIRASIVTQQTWAFNSPGSVGGVGGPSVQVAAYDGAIGDVTQQPSGSSGAGTVTNASYGNNNLYRDASVFFDLDVANFGGGIMSFYVPFSLGAQFGAMQVEFDPPIPKDNTQTFTIAFRHVWSRRTL